MPPLTPEEQAQLAAMYAYQDYGVPTMANYASQLNLFQDMMQTAADPTFLYLQGLLTDPELIASTQELLFDPVDINEANWAEDYENARITGDDILLDGMDAIINGVEPERVIARLRSQYEDSYGDVPGARQDDLRGLLDVLKDFEKKYSNARDIEAKVATGEYTLGADNLIYKPVDEETGRKRLEGRGLRGYYADPANWGVTPKADEYQRGLKLLEESSALTAERENKSKAAKKEVSTAAQSAYKQFLNRTPEGRKVLQYVQPKTEQEKGLEIDPKKAAAYLAGRAVGLPVDLALLGKAAVGKVFSGSKDIGKVIEEKKKMANEDYWAKMTASYAGRGAQDEKRKELARLEKEAEEKKAAGAAATQAARMAGTTPALDMLKVAPYFAAMAAAQAQPEKKKTYVKPKPRVLSDAEIESMANMIAGGMG